MASIIRRYGAWVTPMATSVSAAVDRAGHQGVLVPPQVGVVDAAEAEPDAVDLQGDALAGEIDPARVDERPAEITPRQFLGSGLALRLGRVR